MVEDVGDKVYDSPRHEHRWQGDLYAREDFGDDRLPGNVDHWMLMNRTCHLIEGNGRSVKLPFLVFCAVFPLETALAQARGNSVKHRLTNIIKGKEEFLAFLPESPKYGLSTPFVVNFNMVWSVKLDNCPTASQKVIQLSHPFCEQIMQRFSRWFYTVGVDDEDYRTDKYIEELTDRYKS